MIIWLASYPKSGNTWVRFFLESLLHSKNEKIDINNTKIRQFPLRSDFSRINVDENNIQNFVSNCINCQDRINLDNKAKIFKTHNAFWRAGQHEFTNENNTVGVIYIVRDPRNVITSLKNHFDSDNYNDAFKFMTNEKQHIGSRFSNLDNNLPTVISSWSNHYNSWKKFKKNYLLIKYENLLNDTHNEFNKIVKYLNQNMKLDFNEDQINKAIKNCDFEKLSEQENNKGFKESAKDKSGNIKKFFYLGAKNNWEKILDQNTRKNIEKEFNKELLELDYL